MLLKALVGFFFVTVGLASTSMADAFRTGCEFSRDGTHARGGVGAYRATVDVHGDSIIRFYDASDNEISAVPFPTDGNVWEHTSVFFGEVLVPAGASWCDLELGEADIHVDRAGTPPFLGFCEVNADGSANLGFEAVDRAFFLSGQIEVNFWGNGQALGVQPYRANTQVASTDHSEWFTVTAPEGADACAIDFSQATAN
jgi:hypothetical protein